MKIKTIFFICSMLFILAITQTTQTMHIAQKMQKAYVQKAKTFYTTDHKPHTKETHVDHQHIEMCEIEDYEAERDAAFITPIAFKNLHKLRSEVTEKNRLELVNEEIMPTLSSDNSTTSKVYLINGKAVGFINYYIGYRYQPWYYKYMPCSIGPSANINMLAIDEEHQNKKVGTMLMYFALQDCQSQSVDAITLSTTQGDGYMLGGKLCKYYRKFGFKWKAGSKYTGVDMFEKRLQPHPITLVKKAIFDRFRSSLE